MTRSPLTDDQRLAVLFDQQANLLVSAAAGSGKTTTLTERIVQRLMEGKVEPDQLLIITFTELAAKDLKTKIQKRLRELERDLADEARTRRCQELLNRLDLAQISTIHAFCNQVLTSYLSEFTDQEGEALLEPGYRILDGLTERDLLDESIEEVLSGLYKDYDSGLAESWADSDRKSPYCLTGKACSQDQWLSDFRTVSLAYAPDLDDEPFRKAIGQMLTQLSNLPDYRDFAIQETRTLFDRARSFPLRSDSAVAFWWDLYEQAVALARKTLDSLARDDTWINEVCSSSQTWDQKLTQAADTMARTLDWLSRLKGQDQAHWDGIVQAGRSMEPVRFPNRMGGRTDPVTREIKNRLLEKCLSGFLPLVGLISEQIKRGTGRDASYAEGYPSVFATPAAEIREDLIRSAGAAARFMEVVLLVDEAFRKKRFDQNAILFNDIEHGSLALLKKPSIREDYLERFREIYVDEYQDTSSIQDAIIHRISDRNLLMVGDIKQSIYRFRYANPSLFIQHEASSCLIRARQDIPPLEAQHTGYLALLNRCFRTRPALIDFINDFFSSFLTREAGEIDYDESQQLIADEDKWRPVHESEPAGGPPVHLLLEVATGVTASAALGGEEDEEEGETAERDPDLSPSAREALMAVRVIRELAQKGVAYDRIAILLPANQQCRDYEEVLTRCQIPATTREGAAYPDNLVFRQIQALLALLDNPQQDIPLLSVLLGPFAPQPWTAQELIQATRLDPALELLEEGERDFHDRFFRLCREGQGPLAEKARTFLERIRHWQFLGQELSFRDLLHQLVYDSGYASYLAASAFGSSYTAELDRLLTWSGEPDPLGRAGVRNALRQMNRMLDDRAAKTKADPALLPGAVRVLTRHSSKGLEWDYLILGRLDSSWRAREDRPVLLSEQEGLSSASLAEGGMRMVNNPLHEAALLAESRRQRAEAWRVLYVAMTRAIHGLYLLLPVKQASLGEQKAWRAVLDKTARETEDLSPKERAAAGIIPAGLSASLKNDTELIAAYLAARFPQFSEALAALSGYEDREDPLEGIHIPPFIERVRVTPWEKILEETSGGREPETGDAPLELPSGAWPPEGETLPPLDLLSREIPFRSAAKIPAKVTVTALQRLGLERPAGLDDSSAFTESVRDISANPAAGLAQAEMSLTMRGRDKREEAGGALLGTTMHTVFQFLDLDDLRLAPEGQGRTRFLSQLDRLTAAGTLTAEENRAAAPFWQEACDWAASDLAGRLMLAERTSGKVYREMPFTLALPSSRLDPSWPEDERVLLQGMIDLWFIDQDDQAVLIDFKTDRLSQDPHEADRLLRDRYKIQIDAYARAIQEATGRTVKERIVWLIRQSRQVFFP